MIYSDYLCPWCYNGSVRLRRVEAEFDGAVELVLRSFLLRPTPDPNRSLEKFRSYTRSWLRPASEPESGQFRVWEGDAGPPSHSVPPHLVAKAAGTLGAEAFWRMHERLLSAYFSENLDITDSSTLRKLWDETGLEPQAFDRREDPVLLDLVMSEHRRAIELGVGGVPAVLIEGQDMPITGAHPVELYRRWVRRAIDDPV